MVIVALFVVQARKLINPSTLLLVPTRPITVSGEVFAALTQRNHSSVNTKPINMIRVKVKLITGR